MPTLYGSWIDVDEQLVINANRQATYGFGWLEAMLTGQGLVQVATKCSVPTVFAYHIIMRSCACR